MKLDNKKTILVGFAFLTISMFWVVYDSIIAKLLINSFGLNQLWSGVLMALDNMLALILLPLFGLWSDRTKTKYGKRTPYIFVGTIIAAIVIVGVAIVDHYQLMAVQAAGIGPVISYMLVIHLSIRLMAPIPYLRQKNWRLSLVAI
jgi:Na+/melibiose symporter-like transporter